MVLDEALAGAEKPLSASFGEPESGLGATGSIGGVAVLVGDVDGGLGAVLVGRADEV